MTYAPPSRGDRYRDGARRGVSAQENAPAEKRAGTTFSAPSMKRGVSSTPLSGLTQTRSTSEPGLAVALDRLGFVYGLQGRTADAIAQFERAPRMPIPRSSMRSITSARRCGGPATPIAHSKRCEPRCACGPDHAEARYYLGLVAEETAASCSPRSKQLEESVRLNGSIPASALQLGHRAQGGGRCRRRHRTAAPRGRARPRVTRGAQRAWARPSAARRWRRGDRDVSRAGRGRPCVPLRHA